MKGELVIIHQFIFAAPKPRKTIDEFQDYWVNNHAKNLASKIPQIKRYMIDSRIPFAGDMGNPRLPHEGIAEIWFANEREQLDSLETNQFLQARQDEPNWADLSKTIILDTTALEIPEQSSLTQNPTWVKLTVLLKRKPGMSLDEYRQSLDSYAPIAKALPRLHRHLHRHIRDSFYEFGEARFDSVEQFWFEDIDALKEALASPDFAGRVKPARDTIVDPKYVFSLVAKENWII
jgi:uncharacterized protein (TIGR02118 family)